MLRCFVVDDEAHAIEVLTRYIQKTHGLELVGAEEDPLVALHAITGGQVSPDVTFVDVDMPELTGIDLAGLINSHTEVVFTTAYPDYALKAFEKNALDYMLKPITYERFLQSVNKVRSRVHAQKNDTRRANEPNDDFFIKSEVKGKMTRIRFDEITYIESLQNYLKIHLSNGASHVTYLTLKELEEYLPTSRFSRVHKSFIVNNTRVQGVDSNQIILEGNSIIGLGSNYRNDFLDKINTKLIKSKRKI